MVDLSGIATLPTPVSRLVIKSDEEHYVLASVYSPLHIDTDGEAMAADEIRKMAYRFLSQGRVRKIDIQHDRKESGCIVVESFIARGNDPDGFIKDSWVLGLVIPSGEVWEKVRKGELNGFSFFGEVNKVSARAKVTMMRKMVGETEDSIDGILPLHSHAVTLKFSSDGRLEEGWTEEFLNHQHRIVKATSTESEWEHAHRLVIITNELYEKGGNGKGDISVEDLVQHGGYLVPIQDREYLKRKRKPLEEILR